MLDLLNTKEIKSANLVKISEYTKEAMASYLDCKLSLINDNEEDFIKAYSEYKQDKSGDIEICLTKDLEGRNDCIVSNQYGVFSVITYKESEFEEDW